MELTRREFLQAAGASAVATFGGGAPAFLRAAAQDSARKGDSALVVIQLSGGNDGLNTIVPFRDDLYRKARPTLAIPAGDVLKIDDDLGFHPGMRGCADLLEARKLAVVPGVGYPNPNRSHFESMDIWHTCRRKGRNPRTDGWIGRYLEAGPRGADPGGLHLGGEPQPLALASSEVRVPSIVSPDRFRLEGDAEARKLIRQAAEEKPDNGLLEFVRSSTRSAIEASERLEKSRRGYKPAVEYPNSELAGKLRTVAQLIDAGLGTRIYYLILDGFDTHSQQSGAHESLLRQFGDGLRAFIEDVSRHGHGRRVLVMAFSEFGRRLEENASEGTDHGAAGPMFLAGERVRAGVIGSYPSLSDLDEGDLKHRVDFRRVYATVLEQWLGCKSAPILGGEYEPLPLLKT